MNIANASYYSPAAIDKIVGIFTGSFTAGAANLGGFLYQSSFLHSFSRPVFCELRWSTDGTNYIDGGSSLSATGDACISYSDVNNIYVTTTKTSGTVYYQVVCTWIDNYETTTRFITPALPSSTNAYFNSLDNYQKVFLSNTFTVSGTGGTTNITHNLGYAPNVKIFFESVSGQVWPQIAGGVGDIWLYAPATQYECYDLIDTTKVAITTTGGASSVSARVWCRIYYDS